MQKLSSRIFHYLTTILFFSSTIFCDDFHDLLAKYGLPRGLVPNNVKSYTLSPTGALTLQLSTPCYRQFPWQMHYDQEIKGKLSYGSLDDISGIQHREFFVWVPDVRIGLTDDDDFLEFSTGALSQRVPVENFKDVLPCQTQPAR